MIVDCRVGACTKSRIPNIKHRPDRMDLCHFNSKWMSNKKWLGTTFLRVWLGIPRGSYSNHVVVRCAGEMRCVFGRPHESRRNWEKLGINYYEFEFTTESNVFGRSHASPMVGVVCFWFWFTIRKMLICFSCGFWTDFHSGTFTRGASANARCRCGAQNMQQMMHRFWFGLLYLQKKREECSVSVDAAVAWFIWVCVRTLYVYGVHVSHTSHSQSGNSRPRSSSHYNVCTGRAGRTRHTYIAFTQKTNANRSMPFIPIFLSLLNCLSSRSIAPPQMNELIWNAFTTHSLKPVTGVIAETDKLKRSTHSYACRSFVGFICASFPSSYCLVNRSLVPRTIFGEKTMLQTYPSSMRGDNALENGVRQPEPQTKHIVDNNECVWRGERKKNSQPKW